MTSWPDMKVGRSARLISGVGFPHSYQGKGSGAYPFLKVSDLISGSSGYRVVRAQNWVDRGDLASLGGRLAPAGSIVFPKVGAAMLKNPRRLLGVASAMDNNLMAVVPMLGDPRFWLYALSVVDLGEISGSGPIPYVNEGQIRELRIPFPSLGTQRLIADFLDVETARIDHLVDARKRHVGLLHERWESVIHHELMRGGGETVELRRLGVAVTTGPFGTAFNASEYREGGIPMINPLHIRDGRITPDHHHAVSPSTAARLSRHQLRAGDLVVGRKGDLGRAALVGDDQDGWVCGSDCIAVHPSPMLRPQFLAHVLRSQYVREQLLARSLAATMPSLSEGNLLSLRIPNYTVEQQDATTARLAVAHDWHDRAAAAMARQLNLLAERRQALITAAVTGQFDVSTASGHAVTDGVTT